VTARQVSNADPDDTARRLAAWLDDDPHGFCHQLERDLVKVLDPRGLAAFERWIREWFETAGPSKAMGDWLSNGSWPATSRSPGRHFSSGQRRGGRCLP